MSQSSENAPIDPITLEVVRNKLDGIANEMQSTLLRRSFSTVVKEGLDASASLFTNLPAEALELEAPIRVHRMALRPDSGGAGRFRGGLGCRRELEFLEGEITLTHRGERHYHPARGSQAGADGACAESTILRADGSEEVVPSKLLTRVRGGDRLIVETAGGGGYGNPAQRDREAVREDVRNGKVSAAMANKIYAI